ncbi:MAG: hypothetical protein JWO46_402, partial [Nocardioidaceae bacterium]|nr:hypothetical protein [Nocardioidaceae bacterium]
PRVLTSPRLDRTKGDGMALTVHLGRQPGPLVLRACLRLELDCVPTLDLLDAADDAGAGSSPSAAALVRNTTYTLVRPDGSTAVVGHGPVLEATLVGTAAEALFGLGLGLGAGSAPGWRVRAAVVPADLTRTTWATQACVQVDLQHLACVLDELTGHGGQISVADLRRAMPALLRSGAVAVVPPPRDPADLVEAILPIAAPVLRREGDRILLAPMAPWMRQTVERQVEVTTGETVELETSLDALVKPALAEARGHIVRLVGPFDRTGGG